MSKNKSKMLVNKDPVQQVPFVLSKPLHHLAMIMDGNGRWATERGLNRSEGHKEGIHRVRDILEESIRLGIKVLSVYAFSTENWSRPKQEIDFLFKNLEIFLKKERKQLDEKKVRVIVSGNLSALPQSLKESIEETILRSSLYDEFTLNVCLNYGGQDEIVMAAKQMAKDFQRNQKDPESITKKDFESYLYTKGLPQVDLMIRTSGEFRISNFLIYQIAYAEMVFTPVYWPDFTINAFHECLKLYQQRQRRFGGIKE
jgi:undecaprenyl diphosphate synthase